jgi:quercetin dioxygenase-like cupin family protein
MTPGQLGVSSALIVAVLPTWAAGPVPRLRQMLTALAAGRVMGEHKSPGDASLLCLQGRAVVHAGDGGCRAGAG